MTSPTFVASYSSGYTTNTTPKTVSVTTQPGDVIVVYGGSENSTTTLNTPSGNGLSFTLEQSLVSSGYGSTYLWSATDSTGGTSWTLSGSRGSSGAWGFTCVVFRNSDGIGVSNKANLSTGTPSVSLSTSSDNSAVVVFNDDWNAQNGSTRTWLTNNSITPTVGNSLELDYAFSSGVYTIYGAYYNDAGTAGSHSFGLSAPSSQAWSIAAIEVKGNSAPVIRSTISGSTPGGGGGTLSVTTDSSTAIGDTMVAFMGRDDGSPSQTPTTGTWTSKGSVYSTADTQVCLEVFTMPVTSAGSATYQHPDTTGSDKVMSIVVITGPISLDSITFTPVSGNTAGSSGNYTNLATTTTNADDLILVSWLRDRGSGSPTSLTLPTNLTGVSNDTNSYLDLAVGSDILITPGSTGTFTATDTTSTSSFVGVVLGLKNGGALAPTSTLTDYFTGTVIDTNKWTTTLGAGGVSQNNELVMPLPSNDTTYTYLDSIHTYDLTDSYVFIENTGFVSTNQGSEQQLLVRLDDDNEISIIFDGNLLGVTYKVGGVYGTDDYTTRDTTQHRWWRIREQGGDIYWETSPNASTWTIQRTDPVPFDVTSVSIRIRCGTWQNVASPGTAKFDNLNVIPFATTGWWVA